MRFPAVFLLVLAAGAGAARAAAPIALHPENPHYFLWRGQPTVLLTSGEHYGALLNRDYDFRTYFDTLAKDGLNSTRTFSGAYCEPPGAFNIARNTLAPQAGALLCPWARSSEPGYANGGNKFDLARWDDAYFARLDQFLECASSRGVVVELNLFCPFYEESMWALSPMNARNNVNGVGAVARTNVYTLDRHGGLLSIQEAMVRRIVQAVQKHDNLYFEICNEPYFGGVTIAWQHHIADVIHAAEWDTKTRHLVSMNIANGQAKVEQPHPAVSILNFHYAYPPEAVALNFGLDRVIGDNETGFRGTNDLPYRVEAWSFLMAGGGLFNHLDYSFVVGHEDGTFVYEEKQPGGGNRLFRNQMKILGDFLRSFDFIRMKPDTAVIAGGVPARHRAYALGQPNEAWAVYLARDTKDKQAPTGPRTATLALKLPPGAYSVEWLDPRTNRRDSKKIEGKADGGPARLPTPAFDEDIALAVRKLKP